MRFYCLLFFALFAWLGVSAQYTLINHFSGSAVYGSRTITVTPSGGASTYPDPCIGPPSPHYWAGASVAGKWTYTSSAPVYSIKLESEGLNGGPLGTGEYMQIYINGSPYALTAADVVSYSFCGSGGAPPCYIYGGKFYGPLYSSFSYSVYNAGKLEIIAPNGCAGFTSFAVYCNGVGNGVAYHISFDTTMPATCLIASNNGPLCAGDSLKLFATGVTGVPYHWYGPSGFTSTLQNPVIPGTTVANAGTYTVVQTVGGVNDSAFTTVVVHPKAVVAASATSPVCEGDSIAFSVGPLVSGMTFSWSGPGGFNSILQNPMRYATPAAAGNYTVITSMGGCTDTDVVNVTIKPKPTVAATSNSPVCVGAAIDLFASPLVSGETFGWAGPGGYSSGMPNPMITGATPSNAGVYTVTATLNGCSNTATVNVIVSSTPVISATGNGPICTGDTVKLSAGPAVVGQTFSWSGPSGFTSTAQNPTKTPASISDAGTYTVISSIGGCSDTAIVAVFVNTGLSIVATGTSAVCVGDMISLSAIPYSVGETFNWTGPSGFHSTLESPIISGATMLQSGTYKVVGDLNGCRDSAVINVAVSLSPSITASGNSPICVGDSITFTAGPSIAGQTFLWTGPSAFYSTGQNAWRSPAALAHAGTYTVVTAVGSCRDTAYVNVIINNKPTQTIFATTPLCAGQTLLLTTGPAVPGETFSWTGPGGFASTSQNQSISSATLTNSGTYTATATLGLCSTVATVSVTINPKVTVTASANSPLCSGDNIKLNATSVPSGVPFQWAGPGTFASTIHNPIIGNVTAANSGTYTVVGSTGGCSDTATVSVVVKPVPQVTASADTLVCEGQPIHLFASPYTAGATYSWSGPGYFSSVLRNPIIPSAANWYTGNYVVRVAENGCYAADTVAVNVISTGLNHTNDTTVCNDKPVNLSLRSGAPGNSRVLWSTGNDGIDINITNPGTYWVQVSVAGCERIDTIKVKGETCLCGAVLPNAFTPNGDDINDTYGPIIVPDCFITDYSFSIYNRWGQVVFYTNLPQRRWDGQFLGVKAELGVYMYYLSYAAGFEKTRYTMKGDVTLVR